MRLGALRQEPPSKRRRTRLSEDVPMPVKQEMGWGLTNGPQNKRDGWVDMGWYVWVDLWSVVMAYIFVCRFGLVVSFLFVDFLFDMFFLGLAK